MRTPPEKKLGKYAYLVCESMKFVAIVCAERGWSSKYLSLCLRHRDTEAGNVLRIETHDHPAPYVSYAYDSFVFLAVTRCNCGSLLPIYRPAYAGSERRRLIRDKLRADRFHLTAVVSPDHVELRDAGESDFDRDLFQNLRVAGGDGPGNIF